MLAFVAANWIVLVVAVTIATTLDVLTNSGVHQPSLACAVATTALATADRVAFALQPSTGRHAAA